ncbi:Arc family DNA-binding protein [Gemmobacter sp. LW-1]|uniref:Arc family DNA-binding protein n=1 Tax=Gemmobacter sp. LW-1 TaxID=1529005 RepID=UPI0006C757B2|nr:Arc family DNA-binding protein [Gemmobacter sp. LW-1]
MAIPTNRESDKFVLRLPDGMRDRIKAAADANNRSMNAEIVATLEEKYPPLHGSISEVMLAAITAMGGGKSDDEIKQVIENAKEQLSKFQSDKDLDQALGILQVFSDYVSSDQGRGRGNPPLGIEDSLF